MATTNNIANLTRDSLIDPTEKKDKTSSAVPTPIQPAQPTPTSPKRPEQYNNLNSAAANCTNQGSQFLQQQHQANRNSDRKELCKNRNAQNRPVGRKKKGYSDSSPLMLHIIISPLDKGKNLPITFANQLGKGKQCVIAQYNFVSMSDRDLPLTIGEKFEVFCSDGEWWLAKSLTTGKQGYIPSNFVVYINSLEEEEWFFKGLNRKDAERLLMMPGNSVGSFLIRESESVPGAFSLSVRDIISQEDIVKHYKISTMDQDGYYICPWITFPSMQKLVKHYSMIYDDDDDDDDDDSMHFTHLPHCIKFWYQGSTVNIMKGSKALVGKVMQQNVKISAYLDSFLTFRKANENGLCQRLRYPCKTLTPQIPWAADEWEIPRDAIKLIKKLGAGQFGEVWMAMMNHDVIRHLEQGYRIPCPELCPSNLYAIMLKCWKDNPEERPTFEYLQSTLEDFYITTEKHYESEPQKT
ncbi:hypothetical protein Chor_006116 [Crotalus horridus]